MQLYLPAPHQPPLPLRTHLPKLPHLHKQQCPHSHLHHAHHNAYLPPRRILPVQSKGASAEQKDEDDLCQIEQTADQQRSHDSLHEVVVVVAQEEPVNDAEVAEKAEECRTETTERHVQARTSNSSLEQ